MKLYALLLSAVLFLSNSMFAQKSWIRINQLGYLKNSVKVAVMLSKENMPPKSFELCDALTDKVIWRSNVVKSFGKYGPFENSFRLDFSKFIKEGAYYIKAGDAVSPRFKIADNVYDGTADFLLKYMRQQQCGYNPFSKDSCHTHDGFIVYHPTLDSTHIDVTGGWHDASDYLQYVTTSATAVYQLLFAYEQNPSAFGDAYDKNGNPGANGIPDVLDVAKWGMDWLVKMNPKAEMMFNQIADDRDHNFFRKPSEDNVDYGKGKGKDRPVYFVTGKPQGMFKYKNRSTGVASTAGKYASTFALGAEIFKSYFPGYADTLKQKSIEAYNFGQKYPGVCQTAPCVSPYFYEEDNWVDDMELAAAQLYKNTKDAKFLSDAVKYGEQEPVTPWMGADTANHYQWYPFLNLGHYRIAESKNGKPSREFVDFLKQGVEKVYQKGKSNPFQIGIPFIWCSNNLVSAMVTQTHLYTMITKDGKYKEMEAALRDWLFGCNPWGTSMIIGLPAGGDYPDDPHSAFSAVHHMQIDGGLVDGPVYTTIFNKLRGLQLTRPDAYAEFQTGRLIYHDDWGDYSTNEPTMDGTAGLAYFLSSMQTEGHTVGSKIKAKDSKTNNTDSNGKVEDSKGKSGDSKGQTKGHKVSNEGTSEQTGDPKVNAAGSNSNNANEVLLGGVIRTDRSKKEIHLVFTGHEFADGAEVIRKVLKKHNAKASFFLTGDFYRMPEHASILKALKKDGHYLGAHSNKHVLYNTWEKRDSTLVTKEQFIADVKGNYEELEKFGVTKDQAPYFLPAYEWYNQTISNWTEELGLKIVNFTPGTYSNADYTTPDMGKQYLSSDEIYKRIMQYESKDKDGLNGFILLSHIGTDPRRTDKFYNKLDSLLTELEAKGYKFTRIKL